MVGFTTTCVGSSVAAGGGFVAAGASVVAVAHADKIKLAMTINTSKVESRFFTFVSSKLIILFYIY
jgi:hypothetical protein